MKLTKNEKAQILEIAKQCLVAVESRGDLETRGWDGEDFFEVSAAGLKTALEEVYALGKSRAAEKEEATAHTLDTTEAAETRRKIASLTYINRLGEVDHVEDFYDKESEQAAWKRFFEIGRRGPYSRVISTHYDEPEEGETSPDGQNG